MRAPPHSQESARLNALRSYGVLDTAQESDFDEIVALAARVCEAPIALVTLIDQDRQWFKARVGTEMTSTPREDSFCGHGILLPDEMMVVPDATEDERFRDNPYVVGEPGVRFYAGAYLRNVDGLPLGSLCVLDTRPRELSELQLETLLTLSHQVMAQLELRRQARLLATERERFRNLLDDVPGHVVVLQGQELRYEFGNRAFRQFIGGGEFAGRQAGEAWNVPDEHRALLRSVMATGEAVVGREAPVPLPSQPGETGYFDFLFQPLRDPDGSIPGVFVYSADVTEKVRARQELAEERLHLDKTLQTAEVATFDWDPVRDRVFANPLLRRFFGVPEDAPEGSAIETFLRAIHPDDRERVGQTIAKSLEEGGRFESEYRVTDREGRERWVLARGDAERSGEVPVRLSGILVDITERKSGEAEREGLLRQVEVERERLREAFDQSPTFVCHLEGPDLVFTYANEPYYTLIGFREVIGKPLAEALPEVAAQGFPRLLREVMATGEPWTADEVPVGIQRRAGGPTEERILNLRYVPVREPDGTCSGVYSHAIDVTEEVTARRRLAESEERFRLGQKAGRVGTFEWIVPTDRVIWSPELELLYGVPEGTFEGRFEDWSKRVVPEDVQRVVGAIQEALARQAPELSYEFRAVLPDGQLRWLAGQARFDYDDRGRALRMAGVNVDIHDRKRAEAELRTSEQRFRIVAQATRDAVWDWDLKDGSVWWNEGISDLFGYSRDLVEPTSDWWVSRIHPEDRARIVDSIHSAIRGGRANWQDEYRFARSDGSYLIVEDRGYAVFDEEGRPIRMVGAMADVTKQRQEAARTAFLRDFADSVSSKRDPAELATVALHRLAEQFEVSRAVFSEVDGTEGRFASIDWSQGLAPIQGTYSLSDFGAEVEHDLRNGRTIVVRDAEAEVSPKEGLAKLRNLGARSLVACPLVKHGRLAAVLAIHHREPRDWTEDEVHLLHQAADRMWAELERARAETALRQNAEQLQTIFDNAEDDAIILMDSERRIVAWNRAAEKICGWSAQEAFGRRSDLLFTQEERAAGEPQRKADNAARLGKVVSERWYLRRDGTRFWGSGTMTALRNADGSVRGYLKVFRDATVKRRELVTLEFLQRLTDAVRDLRDPSSIIETALRLLGEHLGVDRCAYCEIEEDEETAHILGNWCNGVASIIGTYPVTAWGTPVKEDLTAGRTFIADDVDLRLAPDDGGDVLRGIAIRSVICAPLMKIGRLAGAMAVHQAQAREWNDEEIELVEMVADRLWSEIERARAEKNLVALNEELEERVADRTARLEAAIKESEAFNYSISHDLRAPLRSIVATSRILLEDTAGQIDDESRTMLERQAHNAARLGVLIDELLRLSRLGRVEVHRSEIDMTDLVEEFVAEMERANMTRGCRFEIEAGMRARGDARLVRLVYSNLLENACKFSPEGGTVRIGHRERGGDRVFFVRDEGVGFDMAYAHKLFLPFERLVTEAEFPGTGIGLANVERIIRRHGGQVWAESEPGKGATFFFTLE